VPTFGRCAGERRCTGTSPRRVSRRALPAWCGWHSGDAPARHAPDGIAGGFVDRYFDPLHYLAFNHDHYWSWTRRILTFVDGRSRSIADLRLIERSSVDLYATTRSLYSQARETEIRNGESDIEGLPDF